MNFKLLRQIIFEMSKRSLHALIINCLLISTMYATDLNAQKKVTSVKDASIELKFENASMTKVLQEIEALTDFQFSYNSDDLNNDLLISKRFKNSTVAEVLLEASKRTNLKFKQVNNIIHVSRKKDDGKHEESLEIILADVDISGKITDENGEGLPGAAVVVKGSATGTTTNLDGNYKLTVPEGSTVTISFVGYMTKDVLIGSQSVIDLQMEVDAEQLEEVVVIGYGTRKKESLTGAISSVGGGDLVKNKTPNLLSSLTGQVPGLVINQRSGRPGAEAMEIFIRGKSTLGNNNGPLVVIDGIQQGGTGALSRLNPNDIESISVLKDASAAIYGVNASNGVILVTTKRGSAQEPSWSFSSTVSSSAPTITPNWTNGYETAIAMNEERLNQGAPAIYSDDVLDKLRTGSDPLLYAGQDVDWYDQTFKKSALQHRHTLSVNGGTEKTKYFFSAAYLNQGGLYQESDAVYYKQYNVRSNLDFQASKNLTFSVDINAAISDRSQEQYADGARLRAKQALPEVQFRYPNGLVQTMQYGLNPIIMGSKLGGYDANNNSNFRGVFRYDLKMDFITEGLSLEGFAQYDVINNKRTDWLNTYFTYSYNDNTGEYVPVPSGWTTVNPALSKTNTDNQSSQVNTHLKYNRTFGDHGFDVLAGMQLERGFSEVLSASRGDYQTNIITQINAGDVLTDQNSGFNTETATLSYFTRVGYNFKGKYLVDFTLRSDGSYKFAEGRKWGTFPGVSAAWRISEESFFSSALPFIDGMKIRASWGRMGLDNTQPFEYLATYTQESSAFRRTFFGENGGVVPSYRLNTFPNFVKTWEEQETFDVGLDFQLADGKFDFTFDYFKNIRSNILITNTEAVPEYYGTPLSDVNLGIVHSWGVEASGRYRHDFSNGLSINTGVNFTFTRNRAKFLSEAAGVLDYQKKEGHAVDVLDNGGEDHLSRLVYIADGLFQNQAEVDAHADQSGFSNVGPGDIKYVDQNDDGVINTQDRVRLDQSRTPEIVYGMDIGLNYKNFDFIIRISGQARAWNMVQPEMIRYDKAWHEGRWQQEGDNTFPRTYAFLGDNSIGESNNDQRSTFWLKNASFMRVRLIQFGYTLPQTINDKLNIGSLRFFVSADNPFLLMNPMDISRDPELDSWRSYEIQKVVSAGINLTF